MSERERERKIYRRILKEKRGNERAAVRERENVALVRASNVAGDRKTDERTDGPTDGRRFPFACALLVAPVGRALPS